MKLLHHTLSSRPRGTNPARRMLAQSCLTTACANAHGRDHCPAGTPFRNPSVNSRRLAIYRHLPCFTLKAYYQRIKRLSEADSLLSFTPDSLLDSPQIPPHSSPHIHGWVVPTESPRKTQVGDAMIIGALC